MGISLADWRARIGSYVGLHGTGVVGGMRGVNEQFVTSKATTVFFLAYVLLIGGIEPNPGPSIDDVYELLSDFKQKTEESLKSVNERVSGIESGLTDKLLKQEEAINSLRQENANLRRAIGNLEGKLDDLENRSRRDNLIFYGISEEQQENESWRDSKRIVLGVIRDNLKVSNVREEDIARAHRLGHRRGNRPIIVKFANYAVKEKILESRAVLKGSSIFINEDFSLKVRRERSELLEELKLARERGYTATLSFNKLKIEGRIFKYDWDEDKVVEIKYRKDKDSNSDEMEVAENYEKTDDRRQTRQNAKRAQGKMNVNSGVDIENNASNDGGSGERRGDGAGGSGSGGGGGGSDITQWLQRGKGAANSDKKNKRTRSGK